MYKTIHLYSDRSSLKLWRKLAKFLVKLQEFNRFKQLLTGDTCSYFAADGVSVFNQTETTHCIIKVDDKLKLYHTDNETILVYITYDYLLKVFHSILTYYDCYVCDTVSWFPPTFKTKTYDRNKWLKCPKFSDFNQSGRTTRN